MFIYTHPQYPRKPLERGFKYFYVVTSLLNFAAFLITINEFSLRLSTTYDKFWTNKELRLAPSLSQLLSQCTTTATITIQGKTVTNTIGVDTLEYIFLALTALCVGIFVNHGLFIATDFTTKVLYTFNIRNFRIRGLIIRFTWIQPFWLALYAVFAWAMIIASSSSRAYLDNYVETCANRLLLLDRASYIAQEIDKDTIFGLDFTFVFTAIGINMFVYLCALIHLAFYGFKRKNKLLAQYENPWEKGCLGRPHKPMVTAWNGAREALGNALVSGTPIDDFELLENAVNFPSRYLEYFAKMDSNEVIQVVNGPLEQQEGMGEDGMGGGGGGAGGYGQGFEEGEFAEGEGVDEFHQEDRDRRRSKGSKHKSKKRKSHHHHQDPNEENPDGLSGGGGMSSAGEGEQKKHRHRRKSSKHSNGEGIENAQPESVGIN